MNYHIHHRIILKDIWNYFYPKIFGYDQQLCYCINNDINFYINDLDIHRSYYSDIYFSFYRKPLTDIKSIINLHDSTRHWNSFIIYEKGKICGTYEMTRVDVVGMLIDLVAISFEKDLSFHEFYNNIKPYIIINKYTKYKLDKFINIFTNEDWFI